MFLFVLKPSGPSSNLNFRRDLSTEQQNMVDDVDAAREVVSAHAAFGLETAVLKVLCEHLLAAHLAKSSSKFALDQWSEFWPRQGQAPAHDPQTCCCPYTTR